MRSNVNFGRKPENVRLVGVFLMGKYSAIGGSENLARRSSVIPFCLYRKKIASTTTSYGVFGN
jgi:hypothetical protein